MSDFPADLYDFPADHAGRKSYVSVRGHSKMVPKYKTYRGSDRYNYILPEYGGSWDGVGNASAYVMPDKLAYVSPIDGSVVTSRSQHREHMIRNDVYEAGDIQPGSMSNIDRCPTPRAHQDIVDAIRQLGGH